MWNNIDVSVFNYRDKEGFLYTNTYPVFLKIVNKPMHGEIIAEGLSKLIQDFYCSSSKVNMAAISKHNEEYSHFIRETLSLLYKSENKKELKDLDFKNDCPNRKTKLFLVEKNGFTYAFLVNDKVIILTDICRNEELDTENLLMTGVNDKFELENPSHVSHCGKYTLINTYNSFCLFAIGSNKDLSSSLNESFFNEIRERIHKKHPNEIRCSTLQNTMSQYEEFHYLVYQNYIVVYNMSELLPRILVSPKDLMYLQTTEYFDIDNYMYKNITGTAIDFEIKGDSKKCIINNSRLKKETEECLHDNITRFGNKVKLNKVLLQIDTEEGKNLSNEVGVVFVYDILPDSSKSNLINQYTTKHVLTKEYTDKYIWIKALENAAKDEPDIVNDNLDGEDEGYSYSYRSARYTLDLLTGRRENRYKIKEKEISDNEAEYAWSREFEMDMIRSGAWEP